MSTTILSVIFRGDRRIRLLFSGALASGAFTSTGPYAVASADGAGASPIEVVAVFSILNTPNAVELAIDSDIGPGLQYTITCTAVPCADTSTFTGSVTSEVGLTLANPPNVEPAQNDYELLLYSRDLQHDGSDFIEDTSGDLATSSGQGNWLSAMQWRMGSRGLPWNPGYGPESQQFVDAPQTYQLPFSGSLLAQARLDDRTQQAAVTLAQDNVGNFYFNLKITGRDNLQTLALDVPLPSS